MSSPPPPIKIETQSHNKDLVDDSKMPLVDHLEELRQRIIKSLLMILVSALISILFIKPIVKLLEAPADSIRFLQLAPGEFLLVSIKVAGYSGLAIALPYLIFQGLSFVLPGLTKKERRLIAPAVMASAILFVIGLFFAWWALIPAALSFLLNYGADVVEPMWSIERYLDFVLTLMFVTGIAFQLPILQLILGILGILNWKQMLSAWRWIVISSAFAGAVLTPSTDPLTMSLLSAAITSLFFLGIGLVALTNQFKAQTHR